MPYIACNDEKGRTWIVMEDDPAWEAAKHAKAKLLLTQPTLPLHLILTGWPDMEIHKAKQEMLDYLAARELVGPKVLKKAWVSLRRKFLAYRTQWGVYGEREFAEQVTMFSAETDAPSSG